MNPSSEDIIVLSDDEDDGQAEKDEIRVEPVTMPKRATLKCAKTTISEPRTPLLVLTEPKSISYGIERGYKLKDIHGLKRLPAGAELMYLVEYELCDDYEFVPATVLRQYCNETLLIEYLQKLTQFTD
jgi:hypothetical protein